MRWLEEGLLEIEEDRVHAVVCKTRGMTPQEFVYRNATGWVYIGRQAMKVGSGLAIPGQPGSELGIADCDIWIMPEPMVRQAALVEALIATYMTSDCDPNASIDELCKRMFGVGIKQLKAHTDAAIEKVKEARAADG